MLAKTFINKVTDLIKEKKGFAIWILAVAIVSALFIWALVSRIGNDKKDESTVLFDTPLSTDTSYSVSMSKSLYEKKGIPSSLEVFTIKDENYYEGINTLLVSLGKGSLKKINTDTSLYTWSNSSDYVEYIPEYESLTLQFTDSVPVNSNIQVDSADSGKNLLEYIYSNYLNRSYKFTNVKVTQEGKKYRIEGNREVNGYPLYLPTIDGYSDYIVVDDNNNLYTAHFTLVEYDKENSEKVKLVHPSNLSQILKDVNYPKEVFQGYNSDIAKDADKSTNAPKNSDNTSTQYDLPQATFATAKSVELVYYYSSNLYKQISPTYRIVGEGTITVNSKNYTVPVYIYANALDPERVYIPE